MASWGVLYKDVVIMGKSPIQYIPAQLSYTPRVMFTFVAKQRPSTNTTNCARNTLDFKMLAHFIPSSIQR